MDSKNLSDLVESLHGMTYGFRTQEDKLLSTLLVFADDYVQFRKADEEARQGLGEAVFGLFNFGSLPLPVQDGIRSAMEFRDAEEKYRKAASDFAVVSLVYDRIHSQYPNIGKRLDSMVQAFTRESSQV